jgi:hypothetical protein
MSAGNARYVCVTSVLIYAQYNLEMHYSLQKLRNRHNEHFTTLQVYVYSFAPRKAKADVA